jgi:hypothetical protein
MEVAILAKTNMMWLFLINCYGNSDPRGPYERVGLAQRVAIDWLGKRN